MLLPVVFFDLLCCYSVLDNLSFIKLKIVKVVKVDESEPVPSSGIISHVSDWESKYDFPSSVMPGTQTTYAVKVKSC